MRKTRIICTIGPATHSLAMLEQLYRAGMNVVRLNMSHGDRQFHQQVIDHVRQLNRTVPFPIALLLDTQGPEIRTGTRAQDLDLCEGEVVTVSVAGPVLEQSSIHIDYADLLTQVDEGDRITVDNGLINLEVLSKDASGMRCRVIDGGTLGSRRHVNLPGIRVNLPAITPKDQQDIAFGVEQQVDFIALSFVRRAEDVRELRQWLNERGANTRIIAKIEESEGVSNAESIVDAADGIMVARGDLGVEVPIEELPNIQRRLVRLCAEYGKRVIVATHLLESMITNPIPTRAEVTDVANAVYEEVDAMMLSGETAMGRYPVKAVEFMDRIARASEQGMALGFAGGLRSSGIKQHVAASAVELAEAIGARGIVAVTRKGRTAGYLTNCRPRTAHIYAFTESEATQRQLALNRSVQPFLITLDDDPEQTLQTAFAMLRDRAGLVSGEKLVVVSDTLQGRGVEGLQVRQVP